MTLSSKMLFHISRSLMKYWGVSLLNITGFAIGTAAALAIALYVRSELTFDRFIPQADKVLLLTTIYSPADNPLVSNDKSPAGVAGWLRSDAPAVQSVARIHPVEWPIRGPRHQSLAYFYWTDPNLFDVLPVKAIAGDLRTALAAPDTMVLTRRMAKLYFGRDDVVGQTLFINGSSPIRVTAVLADFPPNSSLGREIFVSGLTSYGMLRLLDQHPDWQWASSYTFLRLKPGTRLTSDEVWRIAARHWSGSANLPVRFRLTRLTDVHFQPEADSQMTPRGHLDSVVAIVGLAAFVQFLAAVNLASLMTAQIAERRREMAVRRCLGAKRHHLFVHVLVEASLIAAAGVFTGLMLIERLLPTIDAALGLHLSLYDSPGFLAACLIGALTTGIAAGLHPAVVLSWPRTIIAQKTGNTTSYISRLGWTVIQFALLITLLVSAQIVYQQWAFATGRALNFNAANVIQVDVYQNGGQDDSFRQHLLRLKGVEDAAYSRFTPENRDIRPSWFTLSTGQRVQIDRQSVDTNFFRMFGIHLLAGRNFTGVYDSLRPPDEVILSLSAARALGYARPSDAIGRALTYEADHIQIRSRVVGVVDDMRIGSVREPLQPAIFDNQSSFFTRLNIRLKPDDQPATLAAIDQVWKHDFPNASPINRHAFSEYLDELYHDMAQQWWAFGLLSIVGVCLSVLGLTGLSIYMARSQRREIAVRSALGARPVDIFRQRLGPFVKSIVIANLAADLLSWFLMSWWLELFKAHVAIEPLPFLVAGGVTILITFLTLAVHNALSAPDRSSHSLNASPVLR
jgi:putative ABC transport system permease protein